MYAATYSKLRFPRLPTIDGHETSSNREVAKRMKLSLDEETEDDSASPALKRERHDLVIRVDDTGELPSRCLDELQPSDAAGPGVSGGSLHRGSTPPLCDPKSGTLDSCTSANPVVHPARIWNAAIHALFPEKQPIIKWQFEDSDFEGSGCSIHLQSFDGTLKLKMQNQLVWLV